ncbi:DUF6446 family protein [Chachezhania antarctica]|uniref:DUF6446 family protein n=1 Tax=Chachezhania antarctica TaxID=2340860 RepID=UPI000EB5057E|nr:DUF6446 family protein [Chachezhania antarctica]|tara:strand:+ start:897 stop:1409 length:513 start_codon:yes stop_codon:yes gene_type:complete
MSGKIVALIIIVIAAIGGAGLYYLQVYHYYFDLPEAATVGLIPVDGEDPVALPVTGFQGIDAESSPIRYRACFQLDGDAQALEGRFVEMEDMEPRIAPFWFDCFDTEAIAEGVADGSIKTYLGGKNVGYGVDRIVAIGADGQGFAWNDLNNCGEKAYDGTVVGEECPELP